MIENDLNKLVFKLKFLWANQTDLCVSQEELELYKKSFNIEGDTVYFRGKPVLVCEDDFKKVFDSFLKKEKKEKLNIAQRCLFPLMNKKQKNEFIKNRDSQDLVGFITYEVKQLLNETQQDKTK